MKRGTFRKIELEVVHGNGYGQYKVLAKYRGQWVVARTTDSEIYDWIDDDSNAEKHADAKRSAYQLIVRHFNEL